jgi:hypothetical protein
MRRSCYAISTRSVRMTVCVPAARTHATTHHQFSDERPKAQQTPTGTAIASMISTSSGREAPNFGTDRDTRNIYQSCTSSDLIMP